MKEERSRIAKLLQAYLRLDHEAVGVALIKTDDEKNSIPLVEGRHSFCQMVKKGSQGEIFVAYDQQFRCDTAARMVGIRDYYEDQEDLDGWYGGGFYESIEIAKKQKETVRPIGEVTEGLVVGGLGNFESAPDMILIPCNPYQAMRLIQGYTYSYGFNTSIGMSGMCGVCYESMSKPYKDQDISVSLLCPGSRSNTNWGDEMMMISFPNKMLDQLLKGLLQTANASEPDAYKKEIYKQLQAQGLEGASTLNLGDAYYYHEE